MFNQQVFFAKVTSIRLHKSNFKVIAKLTFGTCSRLWLEQLATNLPLRQEQPQPGEPNRQLVVSRSMQLVRWLDVIISSNSKLVRLKAGAMIAPFFCRPGSELGPSG